MFLRSDLFRLFLKFLKKSEVHKVPLTTICTSYLKR